MPSTTRERFEQALADLMEEVQEDRHILAGILCGSLSHDEVWDKSDIDLVLVCTDDQKTGVHGVALTMDDINIHTSVEPRAEFRRRLEASTRNMFGHSMYAKGRLLFSRDPSIDRLFAQLQDIGARDTQIQVMNSVIHALTTHYKARKWHEVKDDPAYTALWILLTARALAEAEVGLAGEIVGREALADAVRLNPALYGPIYLDLLEQPATAAANGVGTRRHRRLARTPRPADFRPAARVSGRVGRRAPAPPPRYPTTSPATTTWSTSSSPASGCRTSA